MSADKNQNRAGWLFLFNSNRENRVYPRLITYSDDFMLIPPLPVAYDSLLALVYPHPAVCRPVSRRGLGAHSQVLSNSRLYR